jgi:hypothetical protein
MSNVLDELKLRRRRTTVLRSGLKVGYHLPDIQECILRAGTVPVELPTMESEEPTTEEAARIIAANREAMEAGLRYRNAIVAVMLDDLDGTTIEVDDDRNAIVAALEPEERDELYRIGTRQLEPTTGET